ncbi:MAG: CPBP family intramembrane metalloprotease [Candidatus Nanopelagicales bacterium]|jgi:membrane protease YdiL (CAAX protease family)|nr:CPBP family intramembrane metalloprotease [Candidatus Nanopelagicales bacterium]
MASAEVVVAGTGARGQLPPGLTRGLLVAEVLVVLALSLGRSGISALVSFLADLTSGVPLAAQSAVLNDSLAPGRPLLDLVRQVLRVAFALAPVALVWYLLVRSREGLRCLGVDRSQPGRDLGRGVLLAAVVGGVGLVGYLAAYAAGVNLAVVAADLPSVWWRWPVLVAAAVQNAVLEEVVVLGYLMRRLTQLGWSPAATIVTSALVRGSYHLYQGVGGMLGNVAMGLLFGWLFRRWGRVLPMVVAHALIDIVAFVGYALLAGRVDWLPMAG